MRNISHTLFSKDKEDKMKVYLFYQYRGKEGEFDQAVLYGFTNKKSYKKLFMETRKMKYFYLKEVEMSKKDFLLFQDKYQGRMLDMFSFVSRITDLPTFTQHIHVVAPIREGAVVYQMSDNIFNTMGSYGFNPMVYYLKKSFRKALSEISYFSIMNWYSANELPFYDEEYDQMDIFNDMDCRVDSFAIFLSQYRDTMRGDKE